MTPTEQAARWLADCPRQASGNSDPAKVYLLEADALAAIARLFAPGDDLAAQAKAALEGVTPGPWSVSGNPLSGRPSVQGPEDCDCAIVHWDGFVQEYWRIARGDKEIQANARFIAWCREGVPALIATVTAQAARIDGLQRTYDDLYADALADAKSDAQEFDSDLWVMVRAYLDELHFDWRDFMEDGVTADEAMSHIRECMNEETRRAEAAEAKIAEYESDLLAARETITAQAAQIAGLEEAIDQNAQMKEDFPNGI